MGDLPGTALESITFNGGDGNDVLTASAGAALISLDDPVFGAGSITRDTATGLDWLDVPISQGRTFLDVAGEFGSGGDFEGFRHATEAEFQSLVVNAGIPDINVPVTGDLTPFTDLIDLVGATDSQAGNPETLGFLNDLGSSPELRVNGDLDFFFSGGVPAYIASTGVSRNESIVFDSVGHWLVRPGLEPLATVTLVGFGGDGADTLEGGGGNDTMAGDAGNDSLTGGGGTDFLTGGSDDDLLDGGIGDDQLVGGEGADKFVLRPGDGTDTIFDYQDGQDSFGLADGLTFDELVITQSLGQTSIEILDTSEVLALLPGVQATVIDIDDFMTLPSDVGFSIEGTVWSELPPFDNVLDGDPVLSNIPVRLFSPADLPLQLVASTVTDTSGSYSFTGLEPGEYVVEFQFLDVIPPSQFVDPFQGDDPLIDSDVVTTLPPGPPPNLIGITDIATPVTIVDSDVLGVNAGAVLFLPPTTGIGGEDFMLV